MFILHFRNELRNNLPSRSKLAFLEYSYNKCAQKSHDPIPKWQQNSGYPWGVRIINNFLKITICFFKALFYCFTRVLKLFFYRIWRVFLIFCTPTCFDLSNIFYFLHTHLFRFVEYFLFFAHPLVSICQIFFIFCTSPVSQISKITGSMVY